MLNIISVFVSSTIFFNCEEEKVIREIKRTTDPWFKDVTVDIFCTPILDITKCQDEFKGVVITDIDFLLTRTNGTVTEWTENNSGKLLKDLSGSYYNYYNQLTNQCYNFKRVRPDVPSVTYVFQGVKDNRPGVCACKWRQCSSNRKNCIRNTYFKPEKFNRGCKCTPVRNTPLPCPPDTKPVCVNSTSGEVSIESDTCGKGLTRECLDMNVSGH
jgi:hypothetical protein